MSEQSPIQDPAPASAATGAEASTFQLVLAGLLFPVRGHLAFNALAAASMWLIGHPGVAAALFACTTGVDIVQQALVRRWLARAATMDSDRGLRRLAVLCAARVGIYITPATAIVAVTRGLPELAFFGVQFAVLLAVGMGAGSLSQRIFWSFCGPLLLAAAGLGVVAFPPLQAVGLLLSLLTLTALLLLISHNTTKAITTWHAAFQAEVQMVAELGAARDLAVAERTAADSAREAARRADRAKSNFLATMSHEIRTPMNGVLGMAQLLKRDETDPVQSARIDVLIDSGEYLLSILNDVLDVSKIDAGKLEIAPAPEALRPFLERVVSFWSPHADERGVRLSLTVADDAPTALMFDALRLRQVLFNLLGNALKFTEEGVVEVIARTAPTDAGVRLCLTVRDTGPGIAADHLPTLFDRFSQVEDSEARRYGGTGLGLAIVRQLVELMGGRASVESTLGQGSSFHLVIPMAVAEAAAAVADGDAVEASSEAAALELRVLAVDDNAVNLLVLQQLLESLGQTVVKASGGAEALEALATEPFDLVLMDIQMPGMTGIEVLQRLRAEDGPNRHVPVIALTADVTSGGRQRYLDFGFTDHSAKPIQLQDLLDSIARAVAGSPQRASHGAAQILA